MTETHHGKGMLMHAVQNHVESFNAFLEHGLETVLQELGTTEVEPWEDGPSLKIFVSELTVSKPVCKAKRAEKEANSEIEMQRAWLPSDCRMSHATYGGALTARIEARVEGGQMVGTYVELGDIPLMVRSKKCNLCGLSPEELVRAREDCTESGGYFLLRGLERIIRLLVMPKCNFPMAINRPSYESRGKLYTQHAVLMRCMRADGSTLTNTLHYCRDGSVTLRFSHGREEWLIPLIVVAHSLYQVSDRFLVELLAGGGVPESQPGDEPGANHDLWETVLVMLQQQNAKLHISNRRDARQYLGQTFRVVLQRDLPRSFTDEQIGEWMVRQFFMVHVRDGWMKLATLSVMFQKLMGLVRGEVEPDNQDTMSSHDVLHPGQLYGMLLKEALEVSMLKLKMIIRKLTKKEGTKAKYKLEDFVANEGSNLKKFMQQSSEVQKRLENFLATGNVTSRSGLDLMQTTGFTVVADKLNQARYSSHFASIHRGQYFAEMKTTTVRKLLPETWGFLCPVHTPDGSPCGLLNHLAHSCHPVVTPAMPEALEALILVLQQMGAQIWTPDAGPPPESRSRHAWVVVDGMPVAYLDRKRLGFAEQSLRRSKVGQKHGLPEHMEIVCVTRRWGKLFTGLFVFTGPGRLVRPVRCLRTQETEWIGAQEQLFLSISVLRSEKEKAEALLDKEPEDDEELPEQLPLRFSHEELEPTELFSSLAALTPFSNHNQSPRNMYQCQMLKQTMATPYHNHDFRPDNKIFRIWCPQSPLVRTQMYDNIDCDEHPIGTNAVVAVITFTGYDMEDAMIINKHSYERGFGHGVVYKSKILDAAPRSASKEEQEGNHFANVKVDAHGRILEKVSDQLEPDGFPALGTYLTRGCHLYCKIDSKGQSHVEKYDDDEPCYVEQVCRLDGASIAGSDPVKRVIMKLRYTRNPVVGDKFSSRHGQKGVMSVLWPAEDMPFTESGLTPDILFNPHGFPSRMTIGMLIESIAGKAASLEARRTADATTFRQYSGSYSNGGNEQDPFNQDAGKDAPKAADYFGEALLNHGYKRLGTERMYSGIHGCEIETDIFIGMVYYQRLRHLVMDKAQVRARGKTDRLTNQPVKGRKNRGGIRFGEMERDSLLAHGTSFLLHDRLMRSSDFDMAYVCPLCGSVLGPQSSASSERYAGEVWECRACSRKEKRLVKCQSMPVPWVFRYLAVELAAMNVKMGVKVSNRARQVSLSSSPWAGSLVE